MDDPLNGAAPGYVTAKAAIIGLNRMMAHELAPATIRVNSVLPGSIVTERQKRLWLTPEYTAEILAPQALKRSLVPEDVARLALFLAADDSEGHDESELRNRWRMGLMAHARLPQHQCGAGASPGG